MARCALSFLRALAAAIHQLMNVVGAADVKWFFFFFFDKQALYLVVKWFGKE